MNRIPQLFRRLRKEKRCGVIAYITCGDPDVETTVRIVEALTAAGADAIELGVPFSDPIADGPVIQAAAMRALKNRTSIKDVFEIARRIRASSDVALIAFSYLNPIMRYGIDRFAPDAMTAGIDALLLTDLPAERASEIEKAIPTIFLLSPTSTDARIAAVNRVSDGFIYYVSTTGVTGARKELDPALVARLDEVRSKVTKPLAVGFGISEHQHYELLRDHCDAIVVGSAIVRAVAEGDAAHAPERAAGVLQRILR